MADEMTKTIYCCDKPDNSALWASLMSNKENPAELMAMMNSNNMNNNPFIWLVFLMLFRNGGLWGNGADAVGENYNSRQIAQLQESVNDNHNNAIALEAIKGNGAAISQLAQTFNTDFNTISTALCGVKSAIEKVGGDVNYSSERVINAINLGDSNIVSKLQQCCCENKQLVQQMGYENQLANERQTAALQDRMTGIANGIQQGFASTAYETQRQTCDIINAGNANTQKILDALNGHWQNETALALQDEKFKNSQLQQNQYLASLINGKSCGCCGCNN